MMKEAGITLITVGHWWLAHPATFGLPRRSHDVLKYHHSSPSLSSFLFYQYIYISYLPLLRGPLKATILRARPDLFEIIGAVDVAPIPELPPPFPSQPLKPLRTSSSLHSSSLLFISCCIAVFHDHYLLLPLFFLSAKGFYVSVVVHDWLENPAKWDGFADLSGYFAMENIRGCHVIWDGSTGQFWTRDSKSIQCPSYFSEGLPKNKFIRGMISSFIHSPLPPPSSSFPLPPNFLSLPGILTYADADASVIRSLLSESSDNKWIKVKFALQDIIDPPPPHLHPSHLSTSIPLESDLPADTPLASASTSTSPSSFHSRLEEMKRFPLNSRFLYIPSYQIVKV